MKKIIIVLVLVMLNGVSFADTGLVDVTNELGTFRIDTYNNNKVWKKVGNAYIEVQSMYDVKKAAAGSGAVAEAVAVVEAKSADGLMKTAGKTAVRWAPSIAKMGIAMLAVEGVLYGGGKLLDYIAGETVGKPWNEILARDPSFENGEYLYKMIPGDMIVPPCPNDGNDWWVGMYGTQASATEACQGFTDPGFYNAYCSIKLKCGIYVSMKTMQYRPPYSGFVDVYFGVVPDYQPPPMPVRATEGDINNAVGNSEGTEFDENSVDVFNRLTDALNDVNDSLRQVNNWVKLNGVIHAGMSTETTNKITNVVNNNGDETNYYTTSINNSEVTPAVPIGPYTGGNVIGLAPYETPTVGNFTGLFTGFLNTMRNTPLFSLPGLLSSSVPSGGECTYQVNMSQRFGGVHTVSICNWATGLSYMKAVLLCISSILAVMIISKGGA
jgi:hypothetical protein